MKIMSQTKCDIPSTNYLIMYCIPSLIKNVQVLKTKMHQSQILKSCKHIQLVQLSYHSQSAIQRKASPQVIKPDTLPTMLY